jgi:hypothetical protein
MSLVGGCEGVATDIEGVCAALERRNSGRNILGSPDWRCGDFCTLLPRHVVYGVSIRLGVNAGCHALALPLLALVAAQSVFRRGSARRFAPASKTAASPPAAVLRRLGRRLLCISAGRQAHYERRNQEW